MNELIFIFHLGAVLALVFGAFRSGKEALTMLVSLQAVLANFFVLKQIDLLSFTITCSDVYAVGSIFCLNLLQERFGKESASKAGWVAFFAMLFFTIASHLHLLYTPSPQDQFHAAYEALLSPAPRLYLASIVTFLLVQRFDLALFNFIRSRFYWSWRYRNLLSLTLSQFLDTLLFSILGLYGMVYALGEVILVSFLIKVAVILGFSLLAKRVAAHEV